MASNEFKVGLLVLASTVVIVGGLLWSIDGVRWDERAYNLKLAVPRADGLYEGTDVKLAGVQIGSVKSIAVEGDHAVLTLEIRTKYPIPSDSQATLPASGLLGDRYVAIDMGTAESSLPEGGTIELESQPPDLEEIETQVQDIAGDIKAVTAVLRRMAENDRNRENVEATLANVNALTEELREIAKQNHQDVNAIVDNLRLLTENLNVLEKDTQGDVRQEMDKLKESTDTLNATLQNMKSVTEKVDKGEGTIGALVNDRETVDRINQTVADADKVISGISGIHTDVYYTGRYYFGSDPTRNADDFFYGNPLKNQGSNVIGLELRTQEDFGYIFEVDDYPQGRVDSVEHYFPDTGQHYIEYLRKDSYRFTFEMEKRWFNFQLRLGVKESGGGVGASYYFARDRLMLSADLFDFSVGSYPALVGIPNLRLLARFSPIRHTYIEAGNEQLFLGLKYGYYTGFVGLGFQFNDDDVRWLFATLPLDF